jgi:uncharacterized protein YecE (DUF72 family)
VLLNYRISRVAADPPKAATGGIPGAAMQRLIYYRLHGSPRTYWSNYSRERLVAWGNEMQQRNSKSTLWVIFDNTAAGYATVNALQLRALLK